MSSIEETYFLLQSNLNDEYVYDVIRTDELAIYEHRHKSLAEKCILMAANLISGVIEENFNDGALKQLHILFF